jgi:hypothetical protein
MNTDHTGFHEWHKTQCAKVLFIDSKDATAQHDGTTHFTYVFRDTIQVKPNEGVLVSLLQASIPYSFYNVREGINDKIDIIVSDAAYSSPTESVIQLDAGNYTAISLSTTFKKLVEESLTTASLPSTVSINYDRDKQKFQFSILPSTNDNQGRMVIINLSHGQNQGTHFDIELGFDSETALSSAYFKCDTDNTTQTAGSIDLTSNGGSITTSNITTTGKTYLQSTNIADLNGSVHSLYLRTNLPVISSMDSLTGGTSQIVAKLPIDVGPGSIIFHEPKNSVHKSLIQTQGIKHITLRLTDDRNRLVSLNGLHFSIALMFEFVSLKNYNVPIDLRSIHAKKYNLDNKQNAPDNRQTKKTGNPKRRARKRSGPRRHQKRDSST